jgi:hypothetical protein
MGIAVRGITFEFLCPINEKMLNANRIILTHCSDEVLNAKELKFERADQVRVIELAIQEKSKSNSEFLGEGGRSQNF